MIVEVLTWCRGLPRPHTALPYPILSVWRIEENWSGNDILIIVNGLLTIATDALGPERTCHCGANIAAGVGPRPAKSPDIRILRGGRAINRARSCFEVIVSGRALPDRSPWNRRNSRGPCRKLLTSLKKEGGCTAAGGG